MIRQHFVDKQFLLSDRWILECGRGKSDYFLYIARPFQVGSGSLCVELENIVVVVRHMTRGYFFFRTRLLNFFQSL